MTADLTAAELERMRRVAEGATPGPWETYESIHAETFVCEEGRSMFGVVSQPATGREDYGRANAEHIATFDPPTVLALIDRLEAAEARAERVEALAEPDLRVPDGNDRCTPPLANALFNVWASLPNDVDDYAAGEALAAAAITAVRAALRGDA